MAEIQFFYFSTTTFCLFLVCFTIYFLQCNFDTRSVDMSAALAALNTKKTLYIGM